MISPASLCLNKTQNKSIFFIPQLTSYSKLKVFNTNSEKPQKLQGALERTEAGLVFLVLDSCQTKRFCQIKMPR